MSMGLTLDSTVTVLCSEHCVADGDCVVLCVVDDVFDGVDSGLHVDDVRVLARHTTQHNITHNAQYNTTHDSSQPQQLCCVVDRVVCCVVEVRALTV